MVFLSFLKIEKVMLMMQSLTLTRMRSSKHAFMQPYIKLGDSEPNKNVRKAIAVALQQTYHQVSVFQNVAQVYGGIFDEN